MNLARQVSRSRLLKPLHLFSRQRSTYLWIEKVSWLSMAFFLIAFKLPLVGQASPDVEQGEKLYGAFHGGALDTVSLTSGNLFFRAPLFTYSQRGGELSYPIVLQYNNKSFSLFQRACPPPPPGSHPPCPMDLIFGPPWAHRDVSYGNSVTVGFEGLPFAGGNAPGPGINTGLSFDGNPIYVPSQSVLSPDG